MSSCPNKNAIEWKILEDTLGKREALRVWLGNNKELPGVNNIPMNNHNALLNQFENDFGIKATSNTDMTSSGRVIGQGNDGKPVVELNPLRLQKDTIIHEYAEIYVDMLGGIDNPQIKAGVRQLKGSKLEAEIDKLYYDKSQAEKDKELIVTAIGREGVGVFNEEDLGKANIFKQWLANILAKISDLLGIDRNVARTLAKEMVKGKLQVNKMTHAVKHSIYEQRTEEPKTYLTPLQDAAKSALGIVKNKINMLSRGIKDKSEVDQLDLNKLQQLAVDLEEKTEIYSILSFLNVTIDATANKKKLLTSAQPLTLQDLKFIKEYIDAFDIRLLIKIKDILSSGEYAGLYTEALAAIDKTFIDRGEIERIYDKKSKELLILQMAKSYKKVDVIWRQKAEREFKEPRSNYKTKDEYNEAKQLFIYNYLKSNKDQIDKETNYNLSRMFDAIPKDIGALDSLLTNPRSLVNDHIQYVVGRLDEADFKTNIALNNTFKKLEHLYDNFIKEYGKKSSQSDQWNLFLELDNSGKPTTNIVDFESPRGIALLEGEHGKAAKELYNYIIFICQTKDKMVGKSFRLGLKLPAINKSNIERITENGMLSSIKDGFQDLYKIRNTDTDVEGVNTTSASDTISKLTDTVETIVSQGGKEKQYVPVHFRGDIEPEDQSYDLMSLMLLDYAQSLNYKHKIELAVEAQMILEQVGKAKIYSRGGFNDLLKVVKGTYAPVELDAKMSNVYKNLEEVIQHRIFGIKSKTTTETAKLIKTIKSYTSHIALIFNWMSVSANYMQGNAMVQMEAIGGYNFTVKDHLKAKQLLFKDFGNILKDYGNFRKKAKTSLLRERLYVDAGLDTKHASFANSSTGKRLMQFDNLYEPNRIAEANPKLTLMYSLLNAIKVKNDKGEYIKADGTTTTIKSEGISLEEAYVVSYKHTKDNYTITSEEFNNLDQFKQEEFHDGVLTLNKNVKFFETSIGDLNSEAEVSRYLNSIDRNQFGNYSQEDKSVAARTGIGMLMMQNRGWFLPGLKYRFKGPDLLIKDKTKSFKFRFLKYNELRAEDLSYNAETNSIEEGIYRTTIRYVATLDNLKMTTLSENWNNLTDLEKSNIIKTITEIGMFTLALITSKILLSLVDDDDEDVELLVAAYMSRRLYSELVTYINPIEYQKLWRSPATSTQLIENITKLLLQILEPFEEYESGRHAGDNKLFRKFLKVTPFKQLDKDTKEQLNLLLAPY